MKNLMKMMENKGRQNWYSIENKAETETAEVYIFDEIGIWGISAQDFVREFSGLKNKAINLHLNSPGGNVFDGLAIFNIIKKHSGKVTAQIDGIAASIASIIALAADHVEIAENGFMMIHKAHGFTFGNAEAMRQQADILDKIDGTLAETYASKTEESAKNMLGLMSEETWFTASEAVEIGLADEITEVGQEAALFDLSKFKNAPEGLKGKSEKQLGAEEKRSKENVLRDVGFSQKEAKVLASGGVDGLKEMQQRDVVEEKAKSILSKFKVENLISKFKKGVKG